MARCCVFTLMIHESMMDIAVVVGFFIFLGCSEQFLLVRLHRVMFVF